MKAFKEESAQKAEMELNGSQDWSSGMSPVIGSSYIKSDAEDSSSNKKNMTINIRKSFKSH